MIFLLLAPVDNGRLGFPGLVSRCHSSTLRT